MLLYLFLTFELSVVPLSLVDGVDGYLLTCLALYLAGLEFVAQSAVICSGALLITSINVRIQNGLMLEFSRPSHRFQLYPLSCIIRIDTFSAH